MSNVVSRLALIMREIEDTRRLREQYFALERRACSLAEWVALKRSCSRGKAGRLLTELAEYEQWERLVIDAAFGAGARAAIDRPEVAR